MEDGEKVKIQKIFLISAIAIASSLILQNVGRATPQFVTNLHLPPAVQRTILSYVQTIHGNPYSFNAWETLINYQTNLPQPMQRSALKYVIYEITKNKLHLPKVVARQLKQDDQFLIKALNSVNTSEKQKLNQDIHQILSTAASNPSRFNSLNSQQLQANELSYASYEMARTIHPY